jgi:hypothetical protein
MRRKFTYDVAFSFAEEDRCFVEAVVYYLQNRQLSYYYYKENQTAEWGRDLRKHLSRVYGSRSRLCIIFVSAHYVSKIWTTFELKKARIKARKNFHEYVLPFKIDSTELPGISPNIKYLSKEHFGARELADAIYEKVQEHKRKDRFLLWLYGNIKYFFSNLRNMIILLLLVISFFLLRDHLTPVNILARQLLERSKKPIKGSICMNGDFKKVRGRGACSGCGGVLDTISMPIATMSIKECLDSARKTSWIPE